MNRRESLLTLAAAGVVLAVPAARAMAQTDTSLGTPEVIGLPTGDMTMGDPDAPIKVIEYASFTCSHCAHFHETVLPDLKANYIDTGKVFFTHREVYFDRFGLWAGMISRCGGPDRYFGISDMMYRRQREWLSAGDPAAVIASLKKIGVAGGLTPDEIDACMADEEAALALVTTFQTNVDADAIDATPTLIINGEKFSNMGYDALAEILDARLPG